MAENGSMRETNNIEICKCIVVLEEMRDKVINTTSKLPRASKAIGLHVNEEKPKYLIVARRNPNINTTK